MARCWVRRPTGPPNRRGGTWPRSGRAAISITNPFYLRIYEVTQAEYQQVMGNNPSAFKGESLPVENVSWEDAREFRKRLSVLPAERAAGRTYRLPTEAEWKYACRAGSTSKYSFGDSETRFGKYVWTRCAVQ